MRRKFVLLGLSSSLDSVIQADTDAHVCIDIHIIYTICILQIVLRHVNENDLLPE